MASLYSKYIKERENLDIIETDKGFITYRIDFPDCIIKDFFVLKDCREHGHGYFLADMVFDICKQAGVKTAWCHTDDNAKNVKLSEHVIINYGFEKINKVDSVQWYKMEVSRWEA